MPCKKYWWVTRPKRKLILIPDLNEIISATTEGKIWYGNRKLQICFRKDLTDAKWKAQNISDDGSGGRTYAALLSQFGLWYSDDEGKVRVTLAGNELIAGYPPIPIITKQLLDFQFPSFYSLRVNVCREFQIQPYRFILNLFLNEELEKISQDEIAFCFVPYAKKQQHYTCLEKLLDFRKSQQVREKVIKKAVDDSGTSEDNLRNIGNTIVNHFGYTRGIFMKEWILVPWILGLKRSAKQEILLMKVYEKV